MPFVAVSESGSVAAVADATRKGATDFLVRTPPLGPRVETLLQKLSGLRQWMEQTKTLEQETARLHQAEDSRYHIVGESPQMTEVLRRIARVAKVPRPVLIVGERGTGKELVARAIHREGSFSKGPFVAVNCAALPHTLLESELFGHEKGAFTGAAHTTEGKFEQASGGTLFLDEIGNMSLPFQAQFFLNQFMKEVPAFAGKRLSQTAIDLLYSYRFPGNVRELKNIIERAVYRDTTNELTPEDIGLLGDPRFQAMGGTFNDKVTAFERQLLVDELRTAKGNRAQAARNLGLRYHQLRHLLKKHGLDEDR